MIPQQLPRVRFSWWFFFFFLFFFFLSTAAFIPHHALDCGCFLPLPAHCRDPSAQSCHIQCSVMAHPVLSHVTSAASVLFLSSAAVAANLHHGYRAADFQQTFNISCVLPADCVDRPGRQRLRCGCSFSTLGLSSWSDHCQHNVQSSRNWKRAIVWTVGLS